MEKKMRKESGYWQKYFASIPAGQTTVYDYRTVDELNALRVSANYYNARNAAKGVKISLTNDASKRQVAVWARKIKKAI